MPVPNAGSAGVGNSAQLSCLDALPSKTDVYAILLEAHYYPKPSQFVSDKIASSVFIPVGDPYRIRHHKATGCTKVDKPSIILSLITIPRYFRPRLPGMTNREAIRYQSTPSGGSINTVVIVVTIGRVRFPSSLVVNHMDKTGEPQNYQQNHTANNPFKSFSPIMAHLQNSFYAWQPSEQRPNSHLTLLSSGTPQICHTSGRRAGASPAPTCCPAPTGRPPGSHGACRGNPVSRRLRSGSGPG